LYRGAPRLSATLYVSFRRIPTRCKSKTWEKVLPAGAMRAIYNLADAQVMPGEDDLDSHPGIGPSPTPKR